ncbi:MAG: hypothetical protein IPK60_14400 [Sandaracinaceae bacterium]|nr:hypothetical protein [Sandaracinaceae bacterium]
MDDRTRPSLPTFFKVLCIVALIHSSLSFCCVAGSSASHLLSGFQQRMVDTTVAIVGGFAWLALKIAYYVVTMIQARKPEIRQLMS